MRIKIIGAGRAGSSLARALRGAGHEVLGPVGRGADLEAATTGVEVLVLAVSDDAIAPLAASISPSADCVVLHLSGSLGLDVLATHPRAAAMHPLIPLPNVEVGAARLASGATFAVAGDPVAAALAGSLGGRVVSVADEDRARYHAAACIAANHVVALLGQVERIAATAGLPLDAFVDLARAAVDDVAALGPASALTGPAARGDWATLDRHLASIDPSEHSGYSAGVGLALELSAGALVPPMVEEPVDDVPEVRSPPAASLVG
jgi:predicted short-subunit dehydrogenase-like oxidoreductase (DUF2520 family)